MPYRNGRPAFARTGRSMHCGERCAGILVLIAITSASAQAQLYPSVQSFDGATPASSACGIPGALPTGWANVVGFPWRVWNGPTPSAGTGPMGDHTSGTGNYLYVEGSCGGGASQALVRSPTYDASATVSPEVTFWYHMFGAGIGTLELRVFDGAAYPVVWSRSGDLGNAWHQATVPVTPVGGIVRFRFRVTLLGGSAGGDVAIDDVGFGDPGQVNPCVPFVPLGPSAQPQNFRNLVPAAWQREPVAWVRDLAPQNKIDDLIDAATAGPFDIVVNYRRCTTPGDVAFLNGLSPSSHVQRVSRYVSSIAVSGVSQFHVGCIASLPDVAFVEQQISYQKTLAGALQAVKVTSSGTYSSNTVEDTFPGLDGSGVNIAIVDTGVDNTMHDTFSGTTFVGGVNTTVSPSVLGDPDDDNGHGTHVASIALGQGSSSVARGVAPGAGLIDVKVLDSTGSGSWCGVSEGLETVYDRRSSWNVGVVNMSLGSTAASDGTESLCQLVDFASSMGIVVVIAAGNCNPDPAIPSCYVCLSSNPIGAPGSATRAITVAAADYAGTVDRSDDTLAVFSNQGPRANDGDTDVLDELKPEITAPGIIAAARYNTTNGSTTFCGTSQAAPIVAGTAALLLAAAPGINAATVKDALITSAEVRGTPSSTAHPTWNSGWGYGYLDAYAALTAIVPATDVTFPTPFPEPSWLSPDISVIPATPSVGDLATVSVDIENTGGVTASAARIHFGVDVYSSSNIEFYDIGTKVLDLPPGITTVSIDWVPAASDHQCIKVEIAYSQDIDFGNNKAQRNVKVAESPVYFQVRNTLSASVERIDFDVSCQSGNGSGWFIHVNPPFVMLGPDDCPATIEVVAEPPLEAPVGASIWFNVASRIGQTNLGGVTVIATKEDCNGNGRDDWFDIVAGESQDINRNHTPDECESFNLTITQGPSAGAIRLAVVGASPNAELYNLISFACANPPGSGAVLGLDFTGQTSLLTLEVTSPLGTPPWHVNANGDGSYLLQVPPSGACPLTELTLEAISVEVDASGLVAISPSSGCVVIRL